jgi:hypothetical protein
LCLFAELHAVSVLVDACRAAGFDQGDVRHAFSSAAVQNIRVVLAVELWLAERRADVDVDLAVVGERLERGPQAVMPRARRRTQPR